MIYAFLYYPHVGHVLNHTASSLKENNVLVKRMEKHTSPGNGSDGLCEHPTGRLFDRWGTYFECTPIGWGGKKTNK